MKNFFANIIPQIQQYSKKLNDEALLTGKHWVLINEKNADQIKYMFRNEGRLYITRNGEGERWQWEYVGNKSLIIERDDRVRLYRHGFLDNKIMALRIDGNPDFRVFYNDEKFPEPITLENAYEFLKEKYLIGNPKISQEEKNKREIIIYSLDHPMNVAQNFYGKMGYIDQFGDTVIDFVFDEAYEFNEGLARVAKFQGGQLKYGFINNKNEVIIPFEFDYAEDFNEGLALVKMGRQYGFIDSAGKEVIPLKYSYADSFDKGFAKVKMNEKILKIDTAGNVIE